MKRNPPLILGLALLSVVAFVAIFGPGLAVADPLKTNAGVQVNGEWVYRRGATCSAGCFTACDRR
ncbi:MAG: hypothetical protein MUC34_11715 [Anaerolineae bacterium]|nr:hypothetical protein [Anaerolineae bacterium]